VRASCPRLFRIEPQPFCGCPILRKTDKKTPTASVPLSVGSLDRWNCIIAAVALFLPHDLMHPISSSVD
jgi:hypothetical protein